MIEYFSNTYIYNTYSYSQTEPLQPARTHLSELGRWVLAQLRRGSADHKARVKLLAMLPSDEQILVLHVLSKKHYNYRICRKHNYNPLTNEEKAIIQQLYLLDTPKAHIAKQLNRHVSTIYYYLRRLAEGEEKWIVGGETRAALL